MINFKRNLKLLIADDAGEALDLSGFRVIFKVEKTAQQDPNTAKIQIYNLSKNTASKIYTKELTRIVLQAGYDSNCSVIFDGNTVAISQSRNGTDTILDIEAGDGDQAYTGALISQTLASGYTQTDVFNESVKSMSAKGVRGSDGQAIDNAVQYPRGRTIYATARDNAREVAKYNGANWSIQDGILIADKKDSAEKESVFLLSPSSGLIGSPSTDKDGINATCCLNSQLKIYEIVEIKSEYINGFYKILTVSHEGDTHGNTWLTKIKAVAIGDKKTVTA